LVKADFVNTKPPLLSSAQTLSNVSLINLKQIANLEWFPLIQFWWHCLYNLEGRFLIILGGGVTFIPFISSVFVLVHY